MREEIGIQFSLTTIIVRILIMGGGGESVTPQEKEQSAIKKGRLR